MAIEGYPVVLDLPVIWGDQDLFGHVNNTIHLRWFETSRVSYWDDSGMRELMEPLHLGPILASLHCDYKKQIHYPGKIQVSARAAKLGNTSMVMEHEIYNVDLDEVAATGNSVVVLFDYKNQCKFQITDDIRAVIESFEGKSFT
jgi:acyl-CoA thioester hydrolase